MHYVTQLKRLESSCWSVSLALRTSTKSARTVMPSSGRPDGDTMLLGMNPARKRSFLSEVCELSNTTLDICA